jgi:Mg2+/Co2+ transporter CorB
MPNIELYIFLLVVCLLLSAFFSGSETAFISLQRFHLEYLVSTNVKGAKNVARLIERPERFLSVVLFGNTLVNAAATALATSLAVYWWGQEWGIIIATVVLAVVLLIFCEVTPKTIGAQYSERLSLLLQRPLQVISWIFAPFVFTLSWLSAGFTRIVGGTPVAQSIISD